MDFIKGASEKNVEKVIDKAAVVAKEKVGAMIGGEKKKAEGVGDKLSGAIGKGDAEGKKAADEALAFGKGLIK